MNINEILRISVERSMRWHGEEGIDSWSALEWAGAMCGEAGEAANIAKKLKRLDDEMPLSINDVDRHIKDRAQGNLQLTQEVADTVLYGFCLVARVGCFDFESVLREVFNRKSEQYGFPERI